MNLRDIEKPTFEMGTGPEQNRFFSELHWAEDIDRPETVIVEVSGIDFVDGTAAAVRVRKAEIAAKLVAAGALRTDFILLLESDPDFQLKFAIPEDAPAPEKRPSGPLGRLGSSGYFKVIPDRQVG